MNSRRGRIRSNSVSGIRVRMRFSIGFPRPSVLLKFAPVNCFKVELGLLFSALVAPFREVTSLVRCGAYRSVCSPKPHMFVEDT